MSADIDQYLRATVTQHTPVLTFNAQQKMQELAHHILAWSNGHEHVLLLSGSFAKNTAITGTTDIDIFISLNPSVGTCNTLEAVYTTLRNRMNGAGYSAREQNVSLGIDHGTIKIDLVPAVRHEVAGHDHSLWRKKAQTWTKTNINEHVRLISQSGRTFDIRMIKIWRKLHGLDFPSFYLELSVLEALSGRAFDDPSGNFVAVMNYLATDFVDKTIWDPANTNNEVSAELTRDDKVKIKNAATATLQGQWNTAIW